jgi:hypothetical protein
LGIKRFIRHLALRVSPQTMLYLVVILLALASHVAGQSAPATPERQRYAILMAYMLKGSHNVRYETMPMKMSDQNGLNTAIER